MFYRNIILLIIFLLISNCTTGSLQKNKPSKISVNGYSNKGFALVYGENLFEQKIISKKISERSLMIFQKHLKINTKVKITNILNNKSIVGIVGDSSKYPSFNNSVLSIRIADEIDLDINQPYVEILEILENSIFIAQKAKTYDEERSVAVKAPVAEINIMDLNIAEKDEKENFSKKFSYTIKIADFYFNDTALILLRRIKTETLIKNLKV